MLKLTDNNEIAIIIQLFFSNTYVRPTLNITLISSPRGSAFIRATFSGTALELKKEQAYK